MTDAEAPVIIEPSRSRLVIELNGDEGELIYRREGSQLILVHTGVPERFAGHGVAGRLVRAALEWAERDDLTIVPLCPYARKWLTDHSDEASAVTIDWRR